MEFLYLYVFSNDAGNRINRINISQLLCIYSLTVTRCMFKIRVSKMAGNFGVIVIILYYEIPIKKVKSNFNTYLISNNTNDILFHFLEKKNWLAGNIHCI